MRLSTFSALRRDLEQYYLIKTYPLSLTFLHESADFSELIAPMEEFLKGLCPQLRIACK